MLRADPDWAALPANLPAGVRTLVQRCLERDRKRRIPDMSVVRYLLDEAMAAPVKAAVPASGGGRVRGPWLAAAFVGGIAITAIGVWAASFWTPTPEPPQIVRFGITPPYAQRLAPTTADRQLAVSPDGRLLVYVSGGNSAGGPLMLRRLDQLEATPIAGAVGRHPFFSYDGKWIGYFGASDLRKVATSGGPSTPLCPVDGPPRGATWTASDTIIFATQVPNTGLQSVPATGGTPKILTTPSPAQGEGDHVFPSVLPDDRGVLFTILPTNLGTPTRRSRYWIWRRATNRSSFAAGTLQTMWPRATSCTPRRTRCARCGST